MSALGPAPWSLGTLRGTLRAGSALPPAVEEDEAHVVRVDPADGAAGVFRDTPVIVTLSQAADPASVGPHSFRVESGGREEVPGHLSLSPDGTVLIWVAAGPLAPGVVHFVAIRGVRDRRGMPVRAHVSRFVPCDIALADLLTSGA